MKQKSGMVSIWLLLGLAVVFQLVYCATLRDMISNVGVFLSQGRPSGTTPRDIADHFVYCVGLVHYFLFGYLYSVKKHYAARSLNGKNGKIKRWIGLEIFCQLGIFFSYLLIWLDNHILYYINKEIWYWSVGKSSAAFYLFLCRQEIISEEYAWVEQYGELFDFTFILAPVFLMLLIYIFHCVVRLIQSKPGNFSDIIWTVWTVVFFLAVVLLAVWICGRMDFERWWHSYYERWYVD